MRACRIATFIIALLGANSAAAAPQPKRKSKGVAIPLTKRDSSTMLQSNNTIDFAAVDSHAASVTEKIIRGLENYKENTGMTHPSAVGWTGSRRRDGGLSLKRYNIFFWIGVVSIGSPPKEFDVEIDTGAADLFILAADKDSQIPPGRTVWDPSSSTTSNDLNRQFKVSFANKDNAQGKQYTDNVTVAGFTADKQTIGAATTFVSMRKSPPPVPDGMLGLAFRSVSVYPAIPLFETLISENKVTDPVFSLKLSSSGGELFIGGTNEALYKKGTLSYAVVTQQAYWQIKMDELRGNGKTVANNVNVIIDTGANFIYGDKIRLDRLHAALGGKPFRSFFYSLPCEADSEPSVTFTFGGRAFEIPSRLIRLGPISEGSSDCFSAMVLQTAPASFWSIGAPFLQTVYTVFDYGTGPQPATPRVWFAELV